MFRAELAVKNTWGFHFFTPQKCGIEGLVQLNNFCGNLKPHQTWLVAFVRQLISFKKAKINFEEQLISFVWAKCFAFVLDALRR